MQLERAFIDPQGLPGRPLARYTYYKELNTTVCEYTFRLYTKYFIYIFFFPPQTRSFCGEQCQHLRRKQFPRTSRRYV